MGAGAFSLLLIFRWPFVISVLLIASVIALFTINRSTALYQRALVKKLNKVKDRKKVYVNEKDAEKLPKQEKKYLKAVKKLKKRIRRVTRFNKNIVIRKIALLNEENLALPGEKRFTFMSMLQGMVNDYNDTHKGRHKTINANKSSSKKVIKSQTPISQKSVSKPKQEVKARSLTEDEINSFNKQVQEQPKLVESQTKTDLMYEVYKDTEDIYTL